MMGISTNGNDCKHESIDLDVGQKGYTAFFIEIECFACGKSFSRDEVVILTKASFQHRENVIEDAIKISDAYTGNDFRMGSLRHHLNQLYRG